LAQGVVACRPELLVAVIVKVVVLALEDKGAVAFTFVLVLGVLLLLQLLESRIPKVERRRWCGLLWRRRVGGIVSCGGGGRLHVDAQVDVDV